MSRRFQFSLRGLFAVTTVSAAGLSIVVMAGRAVEFRNRAKEAEKQASGCLALAESLCLALPDSAIPSEKLLNGIRQRGRERVAYFGAQKLKYERAAMRPWLPVEPDEPPPGWLD